MASVSYNLDVIDLSGLHPFRLSAQICTKKKGTILCKNFAGSSWKNGGNDGQCKCLFVNSKGYLCFDIGWVGCIEGKSHKVNDGMIHQVELQFVSGTYHLFVDGTLVASGLHAVPDHYKTTIRIGDKSGLMKEFRGSITEISYSSDVVPPCLLHTVDGFGHLDRLEPLNPRDAKARVFETKTTIGTKVKSKVGKMFVAAARASLKPEDRDEFDENLPGASREIGRTMRDVGALSSEMGKMIAQGAKEIVVGVAENRVDSFISDLASGGGDGGDGGGE